MREWLLAVIFMFSVDERRRRVYANHEREDEGDRSPTLSKVQALMPKR
jgi:hypothetical protein